MGALFDKVAVHERVNRQHPEIADEDVATAWKNAIAIINRDYGVPDYYAAAGIDNKGRMLEMIGFEEEDGTLMVFHAMKLTGKMAKELGLL
jgi:hypothetical protein